MIRSFFSPYLPSYPAALVYMLQTSEYQALPYLKWYWRAQDFTRVQHRHSLRLTMPAKLLLGMLWVGIATQIMIGLGFIYLWQQHVLAGGWAFGLAIIVAYPLVWAHAVVVPLLLGRLLIITPRNIQRIKQAHAIFRQHPAARIAILGSYGKTSMKELLLTVLSEGKKVAATPANKNVATSHAAFARKLDGDEDILLVEYGEGAPGDISKFASITHPTHAVITGLAAAHLDKYKTLAAAGKDLFSVAACIQDKHHVYVNGDAPAVKPYLEHSFQVYSRTGALGWKAVNISVAIDGISFTLKKGKQQLRLHSQLIGRHQVGPLSLAAALGKEFGLSDSQVATGIANTRPFEHRMQPYQLNGGWVIDDTYNGNIEGIRAGTQLLKELPAKRKMYVTPGLVDQGKETETIHYEMGKLIAGSGADIVVFMQNSATSYIKQGLEEANFSGEVRTESDPLGFYTNLSHFVAAGDLVLMQNDWPDNYR